MPLAVIDDSRRLHRSGHKVIAESHKEKHFDIFQTGSLDVADHDLMLFRRHKSNQSFRNSRRQDLFKFFERHDFLSEKFHHLIQKIHHYFVYIFILFRKKGLSLFFKNPALFQHSVIHILLHQKIV